MRKRLAIALAIGAALGLAAVLAFRPIVMARLSARARALGARVEVAHVAPTWAGVRLRGIDVELEAVPGVHVRIEEAVVGWTSQRPSDIASVRVRAVGSVDELFGELERWREAHFANGGGGGSKLELPPVDLDWQDRSEAPGAELHASGVSLERGDGRVAASARRVAGRIGGVDLEMVGGRVAVSREAGVLRLEEVSTESLVVALGVTEMRGLLGGGAAAAAESPGGTGTSGGSAVGSASATASAVAAASAAAAASAVAPGAAGAPGTAVAPRASTAPGAVAAAPGPEAVAGIDRVASARELRALALRLAARVDALLAPSAKIEVRGMRATLSVGGDDIGIGPGTLAVRRVEGALVVALSPEATSEPSLTFSARVPLGAAADQSLSAELRGGPVHLATLGLREGDLGLRDVATASLESEARLVLSADCETLSLDGRGKLHGLGFQHDKVAGPSVLRGMEIAWAGRAEGRLDGSRVRLDGVELDLGALRLLVSGTYERVAPLAPPARPGALPAAAAAPVRPPRPFTLDATVEVPLVGCQRAFESLPPGLVPDLEGMRFAGTFSLKGLARFDTRQLDKDYKVDWDGTNSCRVVEAPPAIATARFRKSFRKVVYTPEGQPREQDFGPGTPTWTPYRAISRFMEDAVLTTEDGRFFRHHGFDKEAIVNSIRENLRVGRFQRGASTISMQLAKNLYLRRDKTLSRKLEEVVLTMYLEQELTKQEMMELYLNVVEFGPMVYGVGPAARQYFHTSAGGLSLGQAMYLSSVLPSPQVHHFGAGGAVSEGWMRRLRSYMKVLHKIKRISDEELETGLRETVLYGSPSALRPPDPAEGEAGSVTPSEGVTPPPDPYAEDEGSPAPPTWVGPGG